MPHASQFAGQSMRAERLRLVFPMHGLFAGMALLAVARAKPADCVAILPVPGSP